MNAPGRNRNLTQQPLPGADGWLLFAALALVAIGVVFVTSASVSIAEKDFASPFYYGKKQLVFAAIGIFAATVVYYTPLKLLEKLSAVLLLMAFGLLLVVLLPGLGYEVNGAIRWLKLGPFRLQPSEPARLFILIYLASYLVRREAEVISTFGGFLRPMLLVAAACLLLLAEPDFGAASVLMVTALTMMFLGGVRLRDFAVSLSIVVIAFSALAISSPYRLQRLTAFLDPWADPFNSGFQLTQSLIAIGRGEWFGVGLGSGVQKLFYLPEAHTDFVFAVIAEETGLLGSLVVIGLFTLLVARAWVIGVRAARSKNMFGAYLAWGIGTWIGLQAMINIGVNSGILPTKGLTLPLVSSGGSSLLFTCVAVGLLLRIGRESTESPQWLWMRKEALA